MTSTYRCLNDTIIYKMRFNIFNKYNILLIFKLNNNILIEIEIPTYLCNIRGPYKTLFIRGF